MRTTIDAAGRIVVPKLLRERLGFDPGDRVGDRGRRRAAEIAVPSRVRVEDGPHGARFAADGAAPLTVDDVRALMEQGRR